MVLPPTISEGTIGRPADSQRARASPPSAMFSDTQVAPDAPRNSRAAAQLAQAGCQKRATCGIQPATAIASISISSSGSASETTWTIESAG